MPKVTMIHHVNVQSSNRQRTREWYEKVLGAEFLDRGPARAEIAGLLRRVGRVDVDLLRGVDADRRHVRPAGHGDDPHQRREIGRAHV